MFRKAGAIQQAMKRNKDKTYKVNEIFYSLQGEGFYTGTPAVFLRFCGCNRSCIFCDTDHISGKTMTAEEITGEITKFPSRHLVITGGEPMLQLDSDILRLFKSNGFYIQTETNGSLPVPPEVDWVTCSPKDAPWNINRVDELKVVFQEQDVEYLRNIFQTPHCFLQPLSGSNIPQTIEYIKQHPHWRLSLQTHKLIDIR